MSEKAEKTQATEQQHSAKTLPPQPAPAPTETVEQPQQDLLSLLLQRPTAAPGGAGDPPDANSKTLSLQRQQAKLLGDPRLRQPMFAQRRAELFLQLQQNYGNTHARQVARLIQEQRQQPTSVQRAPTAESGASLDVAGEIQRTRGSGQPLDPAARAKLEPAMGVDLGQVTIHADSHADTLSRSVQAEAFTTGSDVYFRSGRYDPHSDSGLHLLAHELTHTVQQSKGAVSGTQHSSGVSVSDPDDQFEHEAEQNATQTMAQLHSAPVVPSGGSPPRRTATSVLQREHQDDEEKAQRTASPGATTIQRQPGVPATADPKTDTHNDVQAAGPASDTDSGAPTETEQDHAGSGTPAGIDDSTPNLSALAAHSPVSGSTDHENSHQHEATATKEKTNTAGSASHSPDAGSGIPDSMPNREGAGKGPVAAPEANLSGSANDGADVESSLHAVTSHDHGAAIETAVNATGPTSGANTEDGAGDTGSPAAGEVAEPSAGHSGGEAGGDVSEPIQRQATPGIGIRVQRAAAIAEPAVEIPEIQFPEVGTNTSWESASSNITNAAGQVASSAGGSGGGGGILDRLMEQGRAMVRNLVSRATSTVTGTASSIVNTVGGGVQRAFSTVSEIGARVRTLASNTFHSAMSGLGGVINRVKSTVSSAIHSTLERVGKVLPDIRGAIQQAVMKALSGGTDIVGSITRVVQGAVNRVLGFITSMFNQVFSTIDNAVRAAAEAATSVVNRVADMLVSVVNSAAQTINGLLEGVRGLINRALQTVQSIANGIPGFIRRVVGGLIDRAISVVRNIANRILNTVESALRTIQNRIVSIINRMRSIITNVINRVQTLIRNLASRAKTFIQNTIRRAIAAGRNMLNSIITRIRNTFRSVVKAITDWVVQKILEYLAPRIRAAIAQAKGAKNRAAAAAASAIGSAAASVARVDPHAIVRGLLKPDGDHFSFTISGTLSAQLFVGAGVTGSHTLDLVIDYPSHEWGIFYSPGLQVNLMAGADITAGASVDATVGWGSVLTFGSSRGAGVEAGFGGGFVNASAGASVAAYGIQGSHGYGVYVGLPSSPPGGTTTPGGTTPGGTTPGGTTPGGTTPPTPGAMKLLLSEDVFFDTGSAALKPATFTAINAAADAVQTNHTAHPDARFQIDILAEASRRWRNPGQDTPEHLNQVLSEQRARAVGQALRDALAQRNLTGSCLVTEGATGESRPDKLGLNRDNNDQRFRDAFINVEMQEAGKPGGTTPGGTTPGGTTPGGTTPGGTTPGTTTPGGFRPTVGWDSTAGIGVVTGEGVTGQVGLGGSYSIPLYSDKFDPAWEKPLRLAFGSVKLLMDISTLDMPGLVRDSLGIIGGVLLTDKIVDAIANFVVPPQGGQ